MDLLDKSIWFAHASLTSFFLFDSVARTQGKKDFLGYKPCPSSKYKWITYQAFNDMVGKAKFVLREAGIGPGDKVKT